jgi:hypothetical protein
MLRQIKLGRVLLVMVTLPPSDRVALHYVGYVLHTV